MKSMFLSIYRVFYIPIIFFIFLIIPYFFKKSYKKRFVKALELCGPVFIKCGQSISLKPYLFSRDTIEACSELQDRVTYKTINIKKEIGKHYEDFIFESNKPIASASIASVFKARLKTGEEVAVKILKPNASILIKSDLVILKIFSHFLNLFKFFKRLKIKAIVKNIEDTLIHEIDFNNEAKNLMKIKQHSFKIHEKLKIPKLYSKYTKHNLLVTEFINEAPLSKIKDFENFNRQKICKNIIEVYLEQVYEDGFFHADFHPGNLFINQNYQIIMIDFGIASSISYTDRIIIAKILNGFLNRDYQKILEAHLEGGYIKKEIDTEAFKKDLQKIGEHFIDGNSHNQFSISGILIELFRIMEKYNIEIKEDLLLLYKTIFFVEAVVMKIDPTYNIWQTIRPWMESWKKRNLGLKSHIIKIVKEILNLFN